MRKRSLSGQVRSVAKRKTLIAGNFELDYRKKEAETKGYDGWPQHAQGIPKVCTFGKYMLVKCCPAKIC